MRERRSVLKDGVVVPVLTPLTVNQTIDEPAFRQLLRHLIENDVHGLFVAGTAGLGSILPIREYERLVTISLDEVGLALPTVFGVLEPSTARAQERLLLLESMGAKAFVAVTPYYCRATSHSDLLRHFGSLRETSMLEMVVYNIPVCTNVSIPVETMIEMTTRGWISACKDSSGDIEYFRNLCSAGGRAGLRVYQGMRPDFAELHALSSAGCVPVPANVFPEQFVNAWNERAERSRRMALQACCDAAWNSLVCPEDFTGRSIEALAKMGIGDATRALPFETK